MVVFHRLISLDRRQKIKCQNRYCARTRMLTWREGERLNVCTKPCDEAIVMQNFCCKAHGACCYGLTWYLQCCCLHSIVINHSVARWRAFVSHQIEWDWLIDTIGAHAIFPTNFRGTQQISQRKINCPVESSRNEMTKPSHFCESFRWLHHFPPLANHKQAHLRNREQFGSIISTEMQINRTKNGENVLETQ